MFTYNINEVEDFAQEVAKGVVVVHVQGIDEILNQAHLAALALILGAHGRPSHSLRHHPHFSLLPVLPNVMWNVKQDALRQK